MSTVNALGYLRMNAPDVDAWRTFATDVLGLQTAEKVSDAVGDGALYLKQDDRSYRLAIAPGEDVSTTIGWEVANRKPSTTSPAASTPPGSRSRRRRASTPSPG